MNKRLHVYGWEHEPQEERESNFASTGFAQSTLVTMSGYHPMKDPGMRRHRPARLGFAWLIVFALMLLALGGWCLYRFGQLLKIG